MVVTYWRPPRDMREETSSLAVRLLPRHTIARLRYRYVFLDKIVSKAATRLAARESTIRSGVGAGLRFDATGGYPGYLLGTSEPAEQAILERVLQPGDTFYDIGANIGFFAVIAARIVGDAGRVFAFEPSPVSAAAARANAARNELTNMTVVEAAVSSTCGRMRLDVSHGPAQHRLAPGADGPDVEVVAIDGWRRQSGAPAPRLVMIDVEGAELDALAGMRRLLEDHRPIVVCEIHWLGEAFDRFIEECLEPLGYQVRSLDGPIPDGYERWHAVCEPTLDSCE